jgi:ABC-type bacteriocin/lantibiotic exporter with double-glycine peptidase domain
MMFFLNKLVNRGFDVNQLAGAMNGTAVQALTGIEKLRITAGERRFFSRWAHSSVIKYNISMEISRLNLMISWLQGILPNFVTAIILSCFLFQIGQLSLNAGSPELLGSFLGFYAALIPFVSYVLSIWSSIASIVQSLASWKTTKAMLQEPSDDLVVNKIRPVLQGGVSINNVTFCYNKDEKPVLKNLNITIKPNELVAITGPSGCGKSTLVRLLLGLEKVVDGSIYYDSQSLENLDLRAVRQQIGTVLQNTGIIAGSIYENICGAGIYSRAEVEKVIDAVGFTEELKTFPMGLGTILSMGGTNLSGGQRQRLLLARALIGAPKILILDEATSSLDVITQEKIISNLEKMNVTRIVIAHRLSTIRNAHQIYVLNEGCVVETGTFQELLAQRGIFATMAMRQKI